jgi:hypothetical protein
VGSWATARVWLRLAIGDARKVKAIAPLACKTDRFDAAYSRSWSAGIWCLLPLVGAACRARPPSSGTSFAKRRCDVGVSGPLRAIVATVSATSISGLIKLIRSLESQGVR